VTASREAPSLTFATETSPSEATIRAIESGLTAHATGLGLPTEWSPRWIIGRDEGEVVQAGVRFVLAFELLFVNWLWVADPYRKHGVGSRLMAGTEAAAREHGCRAAYLDTFTFQAPKFYERLGYREFGRLNDFPPDHSRIWFSKALR
jgi:GNAT superfamily N-acetyltransferase